MTNDRKEILESLNKSKLHAHEVINEVVKRSCADDNWFDFFSASRCPALAAELKVNTILTNFFTNDDLTMEQIKRMAIQRLMDCSNNHLNCSSPTVNLMNVYLASAWSMAIRDYFGSISSI
jgi:hypothetical protein